MKIAIIGAGISGLTAAYYLNQNHQVNVFEKADKIGGHTATVDVNHNGQQFAIDTGFIVFNDWTYPNFIELMDELGVESQATEMSFSVRCEDTGIEYGGNNINTMFAQRRNILRPTFHRMIKDIFKFNREATRDLEAGSISETITLSEYLKVNQYSEAFIYQYILPMGCAIWSASTEKMINFPLLFFIRFFKNHGLLSVNNRPQWRAIKGGSRSYLEPLTNSFKDSIFTNSNIKLVRRLGDSVELVLADGEVQIYDHVVLACHSDQALALLSDANPTERKALLAIPYQQNDVVLHTDENLLPRRRIAWSSWNYRLFDRFQTRAVLTYNMNILQGIKSDTTFCVTLNATEEIDESKIINQFSYSHPVFSFGSVLAAKEIESINGTNNTWFAGAYLGNGFHEDGVVSGRQVATLINRLSSLPMARQDQLFYGDRVSA
ncbi:MAG: putative NAD/FAD-binding protein [Candidatus Azotimanducaceae bacterium]|jgi:predicted NAD/FAD-binding protein